MPCTGLLGRIRRDIRVRRETRSGDVCHAKGVHPAKVTETHQTKIEYLHGRGFYFATMNRQSSWARGESISKTAGSI